MPAPSRHWPILIDAAKADCGDFRLRNDRPDFGAGAVSATLLTAKRNIYTGVCIELSCGLGFCAEVAEMLKVRETHVVAPLALCDEGVLRPCGRCRETLAQIDRRNLDCAILIDDDHQIPLRDSSRILDAG